jgi:hypothetical protein
MLKLEGIGKNFIIRNFMFDIPFGSIARLFRITDRRRICETRMFRLRQKPCSLGLGARARNYIREDRFDHHPLQLVNSHVCL